MSSKSPKGDQLFSGPVTTPEERQAMPKEVRERLEALEGMQEFNFKTSEDFAPGQMKVLNAPAQRISLPLPHVLPLARPSLYF